MKQYFRVMLGSKSVYSQPCFDGNFIGADYDIHQESIPSICSFTFPRKTNVGG